MKWVDRCALRLRGGVAITWQIDCVAAVVDPIEGAVSAIVPREMAVGAKCSAVFTLFGAGIPPKAWAALASPGDCGGDSMVGAVCYAFHCRVRYCLHIPIFPCHASVPVPSVHGVHIAKGSL
jgi:hypothetical protein